MAAEVTWKHEDSLPNGDAIGPTIYWSEDSRRGPVPFGTPLADLGAVDFGWGTEKEAEQIATELRCKVRTNGN